MNCDKCSATLIIMDLDFTINNNGHKEMRCNTCKNLLYVQCDICKDKALYLGSDVLQDNEDIIQPNYEIIEDDMEEDTSEMPEEASSEESDDTLHVISLPPSLIIHPEPFIDYYVGFLFRHYAEDSRNVQDLGYLKLFGNDGGRNVYFHCEKCKKTFELTDK